ncbi:hypothetical protein M501DRAFT_933453, partial [Patellaria atrata CBS 101060]
DNRRSPPRGPNLDDRNDRRDWRAARNRDNSSFDDYDRGRQRSPFRDQHPRYRDRDREDYHSPRRGSRSRTHSPRSDHREYGDNRTNKPSRELILEKLPMDYTAEDIKHDLHQYYQLDNLEDVRVICNKSTGQSKGYGFIRFPDIESSTAFLENNGHQLSIPPRNSVNESTRSFEIFIDFCKERVSRGKGPADTEFFCPRCNELNYSRRNNCFNCGLPRPAAGYMRTSQLPEIDFTGDKDAASESHPTQFLLVRSLEPNVTTEILSKGVQKLYKQKSSENSQSSSSKSGGKIVSTTSTANLGAQEGSIHRVMLVRDRQSNESWRYGFAEFFTVQDATAALVKYNALDKFTISSKPVMLSYIHPGVFIPVLGVVHPEEEKFQFAAATNPAQKLVYRDERAFVDVLEVQSEPPDMKPKSTSLVNKPDSGIPLTGNVDDMDKVVEPKPKKRKAEAGSSASNKKFAPIQLQIWQQRSSANKLDSTANPMQKPAEPSNNSGDDPAATSTEESFIDWTKMCCRLCSRQFKTETALTSHEKESQLHRDNLKNEDLKTKARTLLKRANQSTIETPEYRDRAKERRVAFNQPKKPVVPQPDSTSHASPPKKEEEPEPTPISKGASLLSKMGYSAGSGLGREGTGSVVPIEINLYASGVGLGASGGKLGDAIEEGARNTTGDYNAYIEKKKRERYAELSGQHEEK